MDFIPAKQISSGYSKDNPWFGTNYNMNLYKGCCHGCIYCDSRSSCYQIEDFDTVRAKKDALILLKRELRAKRKEGVIGTGAMSDPYNPFEKEYKLTQGALELINEHQFGAAIATKSNLIARDKELLKDISKKAPVLAKITITAAQDELCRKIEPHVAPASKRFSAIAELAEKGIFTGVLLMPVLPFIEDSDENILKIIHLAKESGARFIYPAFGVTLRQNQRDYFLEQLDKHFDGEKEKYIRTFGNAYQCTSPRANELWQLFKKECDRLQIVYQMKDIIKGYKKGYEERQLSLF